jgi:predicted NBD/HSP70 family sugar kinase
VLIALDQSAGALVGIDFGHIHARVAVADLSFTVLAERRVEIDVDTAGHEALDLAAGVAGQLLDEAGVDRDRVLSAGVGLPGPIDRHSGLVHSRAILPSLDGIDTAAEMERRLGLPVHLDNDAPERASR